MLLSSNCTLLELKLEIIDLDGRDENGSNCTLLELKQWCNEERKKGNLFKLHLTGIETENTLSI